MRYNKVQNRTVTNWLIIPPSFEIQVVVVHMAKMEPLRAKNVLFLFSSIVQVTIILAVCVYY